MVFTTYSAVSLSVSLCRIYIFLQYFIGYTELVLFVHKGLPQDMVTTPLGNALNKTIRIKNQLSP